MWLHLVMISVVVVVHSNVGGSGKSSACWQAVGISAGWLAFEPHHVLLACRLGLLAGQTFIWYVMVLARCFGRVAEL